MIKTLNLENLIKLSFIFLALTPFAITHGTLFPFMFGKAVFIRFIIGASGVLFAIWILNKKNSVRLRLKRLSNPIMVGYGVFIFLATLSTLLSVNPYRAFWGNVERSEGLLILIYMLIFLLGTLLFFDKKDWLNFFKVNLIAGGIITIDVLNEWLGGAHRPDGSFLDNSAVTAIYILFVLFFALMVGILEREKVWRYISGGVALTSIVAIIATGTRGVIVGLVVAILVTLFRFIFTKELDIKIRLLKKSIDIRRLSTTLFILIIIFSVFFAFTISNPFWQKVPGLDRLAKISSTDRATQARLINIGISINAVNPVDVGALRMLFGWGPENYVNAHNQFYDPSIQKFETNWFDRSHNKVLDLLVMNGVFGLLAYIFLWGVLLRQVYFVRYIKDYDDSNREFLVSTVVGGISVAYLVQSLFFFDPIAVYVPIFSLLSFSAYNYYIKNNESKNEYFNFYKFSSFIKLGSVVLSILLITSFIWTSAIPIYQMRTMFGKLKQKEFSVDDMYSVAKPNNFIQAEIRSVALFTALEKLSEQKDDLIDVLPLMLELGEEALEKTDNKARRKHELGVIYNDAFKIYEEEDYLILGEKHLREAMDLVPGRQSISFMLMENLTLQGRFEELREVIEAAKAAEPDGFSIDLFYFSYLAPSDFDGELDTIEGLKGIYMEENIWDLGVRVESNRPINDMDIIHLRESYSNHLHYAYRKKDRILFRNFILQTIEIEEALREIIDFQVENGIIPKSIDTREDTFRAALNVLDTKGIEAINLN